MPDNRNCKNYETDGGNKYVVGGTLDIEGGAVTSNGVQASAIPKPTDLASSITAINSIIDTLKALGITK